MKPRVSVLVAARNAEEFIEEAVVSVLNARLSDIEVLIALDRSSDSSQQIVTRLARSDERVVLVAEGQIGFPKVRDVLMESARGRYLAILDADDVSEPNRLLTQANFLDSHEEVGVVGTWCQTMDECGALSGQWKMPVHHDEIVAAMQQRNAVVHSSAMLRAELRRFGLRYVGPVEDFLFWLRLLHRGVQFYNIPEALVRYRINSSGISAAQSDYMKLVLKLNALTCAQLEQEVGLSEHQMTEIMASESLYEEIPHKRSHEFAMMFRNAIQLTGSTEKNTTRMKGFLKRWLDPHC